MNAVTNRSAALPVAALALAIAAAPAASLANDGEAKMYAITNWTTTCPGSARPAWDDMALGWYNTLADGPAYSKDGSWTDGNLSADVLCDVSLGGSCQDNVTIDDADAVMIAAHGADVGNHWAAAMRVPTPATATSMTPECTIDANDGSSTDQLFLGWDLDILHLSSCQSMDDDNLPWARRSMSNHPLGVPGRVRVMTGFHGLMWISTWRVGDYEDLADDGHDVSIRAAWLDTMYDYWVGPNNDDQCPVAYSIGSTLADCQSRLNAVRYGKEGVAASASNYYCYAAIADCDPAGETKFTKP